MKKLIVIAFMLLGFVSNVSAEPAPPAYYWDILGIASSEAPSPYVWENVCQARS